MSGAGISRSLLRDGVAPVRPPEAASGPPGTNPPVRDSALHWTAHPLAQESPGRSAALVGAIVLISFLAADAFGHPLFALISLVVLAGSMSRYLLPTHYAVDETGVTCRHLFRARCLSWNQVRRADVHRDGLFLSPFTRSCRLDSFRGVFLRFRGNDGAVTDFVHAHVVA